MGLMLSVLVFCVGIIEALSCYEHFQYGVVHCATNLYENARRRSSAFLNYTTRRYRLLCEDSIAEDGDDDNNDEGNKLGSLVGSHDTSYETKSNVRKVKGRERKLGKEEKIDIVKKLLERPTRPRAIRSISMPELMYTEKDLELTRIINELAIEPIEEINVEIGVEEMDSETVAEEFNKLFIESEGGLKDFSVTSNGGVPGVFLDRERSFMTEENSMRFEPVNKTEDEMKKEKKYESVTGESELNEKKGKMSNTEGNRVEQNGNGVTSDTGIDFMDSKELDKKEENVCLVDNLISDRFNKGPYLKRSVSVDFDISSYFENRSLPRGKPKVAPVSKSSLEKSPPQIPPFDESTRSSDFDNEIFEKVEGPVEVIEETFEKLYENLSEELPDLINDEEIIRVINNAIDINDGSEVNVEEVEFPGRQERKLTSNEVFEEPYGTLPDKVIGNVVDNDVIGEIDIEKVLEGPRDKLNTNQDEAFEELYGNLSSDSQYFVSDEELSKVIDNIVGTVIRSGINMSNVEFSKQKLSLSREKGETNISNEIYMELANRIVNACLEEIRNQRFEKVCPESNYLKIEEEISKTKAFISKSENPCNDGTDFHLSDLVSAKTEKGNQDGDKAVFVIKHFSDDPNQRFENYEKGFMPKAREMKNSEGKFDETNGNESLAEDASQSQEKEILKDTNDLMNFNSTALEESLMEVGNELTSRTPIIAMTSSGDKTETNIEDKVAPENFVRPKSRGNDKDTQILAITCPNFPAIEFKTMDTNEKVSFDECSGKRQEVIPMEWKVDEENEKPLMVEKVEGGEEKKVEAVAGDVNADARDEEENLSKCENILKIVQETVVEEKKGNENQLEDLKSESTGNLKVIEESENEKTKFTESSKKEVKEDDSRETCIPKEDPKGAEVDKTAKEDLIEVKEIRIDVGAQAAKDSVRVEESEMVKDKNLCNGNALVVARETEVVEPETEVKVGDELENGLEPKVVTRDCGVDLVCQVTTLSISSGGETGVESGGVVKEMCSEVVESLPDDTQCRESSSETVENSLVDETKSEGSSFTVKKDNVESKNDVPNEPKNLNRIDKSLKDETEKNAAPEAFWLIFSGEYTKAMSKDWHSGHFSCWQCDEALTGQRYVLRDDHPYCIKCYESVFANVCEECNKIIGIDSKDLSYKDKHWHEACFLCNKCRVSLVDKQFGSKADKIYCGNCYDAQFASRCDGCGEIFRAGTKKMEYKTRQWHEKCFCCCVCKTPIGTKSFIPREQEIYCATCYEEKFATRCVKCNKIITSGGVTYKNEPWHRECFTCTNCNTSLAGQRFTSRDEKPYCADCFGELFAKRCTACSRPITGIGGTRFISFEDRHWHNDCFICASCKTSLVGRGFITDGDDIICPECAKQKLM